MPDWIIFALLIQALLLGLGVGAVKRIVNTATRGNALFIRAAIKEMECQVMPKIAEILQLQNEALEAIRADTDRDSATRGLIKMHMDTINSLTAQLEAAGSDPARIDEVLANMKAIREAQNADAEAEAVTEGTPDDPDAP